MYIFKNIRRELILWLFLIIPYIYLFQIWDKLPDVVPTHFDFSGKPDGWSSKKSLLFLPGLLGIGIYVLMIFLPSIDPKNNLALNDPKYYKIRFSMVGFFSILSIFILDSSLTGKIGNTSLIFGFIGGLFAVLGNLFKDIKPNYYIGIRTPWTLESEKVWINTHQFGAKIWTIGGISILILSILLRDNPIFLPYFIGIILIIVLVPMVYSYIDFKRNS